VLHDANASTIEMTSGKRDIRVGFVDIAGIYTPFEASW